MNKGTSQELRKNKALDTAYIKIDERSMLDMVRFTLDFSEYIIFNSSDNKTTANWQMLLLQDSAFIMAMIASTDLNKLQISSENTSSQAKNPGEKDILNELTNSITTTIENWSELLKHTNDQKTLFTEIGQAIDSIRSFNQNFQDIQSSREAYQNAYGNIVFIKEKATKKFEQEIFNSSHNPHIGLFLAFLKLYKNVQNDINLLTQKHLDFYYLDLLQQKKKEQEKHTALIAIQLQKGTDELLINEGEIVDLIFEGKKQLRFEATATSKINRAEITEVRTLYQSDYYPFNNKFEEADFSINILYEEDILKEKNKPANTNEIKLVEFPATLGEEQTHHTPSFRNISLSNIGIVVSSPALILEKGKQEIQLIFKITTDSYKSAEKMFDGLANQEILEVQDKKRKAKLIAEKENLKRRIVSKFFAEAFQLSVTNSSGWETVEHVVIKIDHVEKTLTCSFELNGQTDKLVLFDPAIHEGDFKSDWPCVKLILNNEAQYHPYKFIKGLVIEHIEIKASVSEATNLTFSNSLGNLDNSIPFTPFGPTPIVGSYLRIQSPVILQKNLTELKFHICWIGLPQLTNGFAEYYSEYPDEINNKVFKAVITRSRNNINTTGKNPNQPIELFKTKEKHLENETEITVNLQLLDFNNQTNGSVNASGDDNNSIFIVLTEPKMAFGHQLFTEIYADAAIKSSKFRKSHIPLPKQPYTPVMEHLVANYTNMAKEIMLRKQDDKGSDIKLIHLYPFGHIQVFPGPIKSESFLFPQIEYKGNLLLGLENINANDIVCIGFELVPAVYIHTIIKPPVIEWEYLSNNEWVQLEELRLEDSTKDLIKSGIVKIKLPKEIQFDNTRLPSGKFWIRAAYKGKEDINSRIKNVFLQAVSLSSNELISDTFINLQEGLKIQKINIEGKKGIDKITGPFALEINTMAENENSFYNSIGDQLRHKNQAVSNWDVERIILDKFKQVEKVRVYGRSNHPKELVKGSHLQIVLIPRNSISEGSRIRSTNIDYETLNEVKDYISQFVSPFVKIEVSNPVYEQIKIRCKVKFYDLQKGGYFRNELNNELISYLSPDIENSFIEKGFDESISKTAILNFIESRPYVDFVTEFSVLQLVEVQKSYKIIDTAKITKIEDLRTISPYAILTSAPEHQIEILLKDKSLNSKISGLGDLSIESDFVISDSDGNYI